ncbi:hypothetical protein lerEdw1_000076 [Lerista edwardsae]|nr:hypothetical protein lerEdw1_000076 [Lerista edwardsae]
MKQSSRLNSYVFSRLNLEEELDQMKVRVSMDKATIQELNMFLQQEREELLFRLGEEDGVRNSTPKKNVKEISAETLQKHHREEGETREKELEKLLKKITEIKEDKAELQLMIDGLEREVTSLKRQVAEANALRNENEDLLSQVKQLQSSLDQARIVGSMATAEVACVRCRCRSAKVKLKTGKKKSVVEHHQSFLNQSIKVMSSVFENFSKDGWEDMSESSDSEILPFENLGTVVPKAARPILATDKNDNQEQNKMEDDQMPPCSTHLEGNNECCKKVQYE